MAQFNQKVDEYILNSADFAKPILEHLLQVIHETCPEAEESIKCGIPHFDYKGEMMCMFAAFKQHCSFSLWKAELMTHPKLKENLKPGQKTGNMDKLKSLFDLPPKRILAAYIKEAMALNAGGIKKAKPVSEKPKVIEVPGYFSEKLAACPAAKTTFENKSASFRKDYLVWITDAKTDATREKRMEQSLEWIAAGKGRFWLYEKK